jgi:predicted  nucleic acid-binding Zn-ribbon protein
MLDYSAGIDELERVLVGRDGLANLCLALREAGSLESQAAGAEKRLAAANDALAQVGPQLEAAKAAFDQATQDAVETEQAARYKAANMLVEADQAVADKTAAATVAADQLVADAKGKADALLQAGKDAKFQADQEAGAVKAQTDKARADLAQAQSELDTITAKIAAARAAMADMLK